MAKTAEPPLSQTVPRVVLPLLKVTEPVAMPPYCPETVVVKVTFWARSEGFGDEVKVVVELAWLTCWLIAFD